MRLFAFALAVALAAPVVADEFELAPHEKQMVAECNAYRARCGLPALVPAPWLMQRARSHCRWMLSNGMIHSRGVAENIAYGQPGVLSVTRTWINSGGHAANMRGGHTHIGVAGYTSPQGSPYWCQQFGGAVGSPEALEGGGGGNGASSGPIRGLARRVFFRRR